MIPKQETVPHFEKALIGCLLRVPEATEKIPLRKTDFVAIGTGEAFEAIKQEFHETNAITMASLRRSLNRSIGQSMRPAGLMVQWITDWVDHWHWRFYASQVAKASYVRLLREIASEMQADLSDPLLSVNSVEQRCRERAEFRNQFRRRIEVLR